MCGLPPVGVDGADLGAAAEAGVVPGQRAVGDERLEHPAHIGAALLPVGGEGRRHRHGRARLDLLDQPPDDLAGQRGVPACPLVALLGDGRHRPLVLAVRADHLALAHGLGVERGAALRARDGLAVHGAPALRARERAPDPEPHVGGGLALLLVCGLHALPAHRAPLAHRPGLGERHEVQVLAVTAVHVVEEHVQGCGAQLPKADATGTPVVTHLRSRSPRGTPLRPSTRS